MKAKIVIPALLVLVVSALAGNWIYGNMSAKKIDAFLKHSQDKVPVEYEEIKVNPLFSKITFKNFYYELPDKSAVIESELLVANIKHSEAIEIAQKGKVEKLTKLGLDFNELIIKADEKEVFVSENFVVDFEGNMNEEKLKNLSEKFPEENQTLVLTIINGEIKNMPNQAFKLNNNLVNGNVIEKANLKFELKPGDKEISLEDIVVKTATSKMNGEMELDYNGNGFDDLKVLEVELKYDAGSLGKVDFSDENFGAYTMDFFESFVEGRLKLDENGELLIDESSMDVNFEMKDLEFDFAKGIKNNIDASTSMLGINSEDIKITEFVVNSSLKSGKLEIKDTRLILPMLEADLKGNLVFGTNEFEEGEIKDLKMEITNLNPKLSESLQGLASTFGFKIPFDGDDIILEVKGTVKNPQVKGVHY